MEVGEGRGGGGGYRKLTDGGGDGGGYRKLTDVGGGVI